MDVNGEMVVVQFLHPGREHVPSAGVSTMDWNQGKHRRKFLRVAGRCLDRQDALRSGTVSVWAGWEAQSRVLERHAGPAGKLPRFVHEPILARPTRREVRQNTDPYVFGEAFLYSNCRQFSGRGRPTRLQHLAAESLILFGAHLAGRFVLDTVLVVASRTPYTFGDVGRLRCPVSPAFRVATLEPLADLPDGHAWSAQLYRGVMYQDSQRGRMFSFAPARLDGARFSRPALRRSRFVNPDMTQGFKITTASTTTVQAVWEEVVCQVRDHDHDLAIHLTEPELLTSARADRPRRATHPAAGCTGTAPIPDTCTPITQARTARRPRPC
jgi:hypothetical protein